MGVSHRDLQLVVQLGQSGYVAKGAAVMEIGAQQLSDSVLRDGEGIVAALQQAFAIAGPPVLTLPRPVEVQPAGGRVQPQSATAPMAEPLWTALGFRYAAIDLDGSPHSIPLDLNFDSVAAGDRNRFDLVTNFGTTEHVANQLNAFKVIHDLTAPGGVMMHDLPGHGYLDHGLFNYNPKFFVYLARSNSYEVLYLDLRINETAYDFPAHLIETIAPFAADIRDRAPNYRIIDGGVQVVLKKVGDAEFVPPLDVPNPESLADEAWMGPYAPVPAPGVPRRPRRRRSLLSFWRR